MTLPAKIFVRPALTAALLLLVPLVAMQFSPDVTWTLFDFLVAGALLFSTGLAGELILRQATTPAYRLAAGLALGTGLFLVWANLAVGLIGSENNPANLLYGGVLAVAVVGAVLARLRPLGLARALLATALAQALVPLLAWLVWQPQSPAFWGNLGLPRVLLANAFFVGLWLGAAWLFRRAGAASGAGRERRLG